LIVRINPVKTPKKISSNSDDSNRKSGRKRKIPNKHLDFVSTTTKSPMKRKAADYTARPNICASMKTPHYETGKLEGVSVYRTGRDDEICIPTQTFGFLGFTSQLWKTALTMKDNQHKVLFNIRPKHVKMDSSQEENRYRMLARSGVEIEKGSAITQKSDIIFIDYSKEDAYEFLSNVVNRVSKDKMIINMAIGLNEKQVKELAKRARDRGMKWMNLYFLGTTDSIWKMDSMALCDGDGLLFDICLMSLKCLTDSIYYFGTDGQAVKYKLTVDSIRGVHAMSICDNELLSRKLGERSARQQQEEEGQMGCSEEQQGVRSEEQMLEGVRSKEQLLQGYKDVGFECDLHNETISVSYEESANQPVITCSEIHSSMTEYNSLKLSGKNNKLPAFYDRKISTTLEKTLAKSKNLEQQAVALYQYEVESDQEDVL